MEKPKRSKASKHEDEVNFISNMPDHILLLILSHIRSIEEVIRTSILSRRWRHLWTAIPTLDISYSYGGKFTKIEFIEFVYWILASKTVDLDSFCLCCYNNYSMSTIWRWIHMAVRRNVKQIALSGCPKEMTEAIELPHCLVSCGSLEVLRLSLSNRGLSLPKFTGFSALRVLDLSDADLLEDEDLVKIFSSCPVLEDLSLIGCLLGQVVCISCSKLKRLTIINWDEVSSHDIKISSPQLADLDIGVCLSDDNTNPVLFYGNSHFKWTHLYISCEGIDAACDSALSNLKTLKLSTTLDAFTVDEVTRFLKYCPKAEKLQLTITKEYIGTDYYGRTLDEDEIRRRILTHDVKRVEFFEFKGEKPKLVIESSEDMFGMYFTWGNKAKFSDW